MRRRGIEFATITLAAGISSTGDPALDRRLPFDEPYRDPACHRLQPSRRARADGGRIVAVGTTVVRALEHAASTTERASGRWHREPAHRTGYTRSRVVDVILSGTHEPAAATTRCCARSLRSRARSRQRRARDPRVPDPRVRRLGPDRAARRPAPRPTRRAREIGGRNDEAESPQPDRQRRRQGSRLPAEALRAARHGQKQRHHGRPLRRRRLRAGVDEGGPLGRGHLPAELPHRLHADERREGERDQPAPEGRRAGGAAAGPGPRGLGFYFNAPGGFMVEVACW